MLRHSTRNCPLCHSQESALGSETLSGLLFGSAAKREKWGSLESSDANARHKELRFALKLTLSSQIKQFDHPAL